ncbi:MAG: threonine synthase [Candidatus Izimaplasma sp.]|nr:threonine synthase [Candidatus Izimaplasma bacterium]
MILSTRSNQETDIETALLNGLADDGGLYVFDQLPHIFSNNLKDLDYKQMANHILGELLPFQKEDIKKIITQAYQSFPNDVIAFSHHNQFSFLELYHGPTFSFKDIALQLLPRLIEHTKKQQHITKQTLILTATSGDTGSAALAGYEPFKDALVIVLYPKEGVSAFQARQMNSYQDDQHHIYGIDGNFDDCQNIIKDVFAKIDRSNVLVTSANSINIGRILSQIVYYFASYKHLIKGHKLDYGQSINVVVPSGNFGNVLSLYYAKQMGLPIHKMIIASNQNNVLTTFFNTGVYAVKDTIKNSMSPSMDISIPSNLERYLFDLLEHDHNKLNSLMETLKRDSKIVVEEVLYQTDFYADYASEKETLETMKETYQHYQKLIDPHTAVAKKVYDKYRITTSDDTPTMIVSTASPFKFIEPVCRILDIPKSATLFEQIKKVGQLELEHLDNRIIDLFKHPIKTHALNKKDALKVVLKTIENTID